MIIIYLLMTWLLGSNHLQFYVPLDDRANDLLTTTSVTQAMSDVYDNNSGSITAAKILALFRPDLDLSLRWTQKRPFRPSKPPVDDWSERGLTTVTEDWTTTTTNYNNDLTNLNNSYRLTYLTLYWLLPTNELTKPKNKHRNQTQQKLTRLQRTKDKKRHKTDDNWVRNISSRPLDKTETQVLAYGLKHSVTPKHIPTEAIVSSVEAVLSRQRELSESAKDNIRSRIASTIQSSSLTDSNLTKDERQALKRLKTNENIVILPADKRRVTVVMDKTDYYDKMDILVNA